MISRNKKEEEDIPEKEKKESQKKITEELLIILSFPKKVLKVVAKIGISISLLIIKYIVYSLTYVFVTTLLTYTTYYLIKGLGVKDTGSLIFYLINRAKMEIWLAMRQMKNSNKVVISDFYAPNNTNLLLPECIEDIEIPIENEATKTFLKKNGKQLIKIGITALPIIREKIKTHWSDKGEILNTPIERPKDYNFTDFGNDPRDLKLANELRNLSMKTET